MQAKNSVTLVLNPVTGKIMNTLPKYTPELIPVVRDYIEANDYPLIEEVALLLNVYETTIQNWKKNYEEFNRECQRLLLKQKAWLLRGTLDGHINVIGGIFQLKANHGLRDNPDADRAANVTVNNIDYKNSSKLKLKTRKKLKAIKDNTIISDDNDKVDKQGDAAPLDDQPTDTE